MRILKHLTSWTQHEKTLQETITFTDERKSPFSYSDPEGNMEKIKQPKTLQSSRNRTLHK